MKLLLIFSMFLSILGADNKVSSIKLERKYKVESTFSGNTAFDESFHLILAKNIEEKQIEVIPIVNRSGSLTRLSSIAFDKMPSIQSFHNNGDVLSLVLGFKEKRAEDFVVVDVNLTSGKSVKSEIIPGKDFKSIIRKADKNIMVFSNKRSFILVEIEGASGVRSIKADVKKSLWPFLEELHSNTLEAVNTDEFVSNGSIKKFKCYFENGNVFVTQENYEKGFTAVAKLELDESLNTTMEIKTFTLGERSKKLVSYINHGQLFQLKTNKDSGALNIYNLDNGSPISVDLASLKPLGHAEGFTGMEDYLKKASKGKYQPTVSVNETKRGNWLLRFDYVLKYNYGYHYNWWWHHHMMMHQHMMMQQQIRMNMPSGFGPTIADLPMLPIDERKHYFEVILDSNNNLVNSNEDTLYQFVDKKKHIDKVDKDTRIKDATTVFLQNEMRYFGYEVKSQSFKVISRKVND